MPDDALERMRARARAVRARAEVRRWEYRQRNLAAGVWFRLRRVLADAREAYVISEDAARQLTAEGHRAEPAGAELSPEKAILFVSAARLAQIEGRLPIPVRLGPEFLEARVIALVPFDRAGPPVARGAG
jgi:uncharacterized protein involved in type VI secretion and phage assembly